jgi:transposase
MALKVKKLTAAEQAAIEKLAHSRTAPAREVERASLILLADRGKRVPAIAQELDLTETTVRTWLKRFNEAGLDGLQDRPRAGRPVTYQPEQVAEVIATALTDPRQLNQPFACWTLDRLATYLNEEKKIAIKRSRIDEVLLAEGLRWRTQETWFGERVDPEFAKKRGVLKRSTPLPLSRVR